MFKASSNDYSSNFVIEGSAKFTKLNIGGSFSRDYREIKTDQATKKTVTIRNEISHLLVDVLLDSSCPINPQVKKEIIQISEYISTNQFEQATYAAQLFVKRYGTHVTSRLQLGASLVEEDFVSSSEFYSSQTTTLEYKAASTLSFLSTFKLSSSLTTTKNSSRIQQLNNKIVRKLIHKKGGDILIVGSDIQSWQATVQNNPTIVRRGIDNITSFIQSDQISELTELELSQVREEINRAVLLYFEMNVIRGCMNPYSPSFNWIANVDDSSCSGASQNAQFGGFIRTCKEDRALKQ